MKLLPRKIDIDRAKTDERKREIDEGLNLARKVDTLREQKQIEEKNLSEYRDAAIRNIQIEIYNRIKEKDLLDSEVKALGETRKELLKPLNKEWNEVNKIKNEIELSKKNIEFIESVLVDERNKLQTRIKKIDTLNLKAKEYEQRSEDLYKESVHNEKRANQIRQEAEKYYSKKEKEADVILAKANQHQKSVEVFETTLKIKETKLKEREKELSEREKKLNFYERQYRPK